MSTETIYVLSPSEGTEWVRPVSDGLWSSIRSLPTTSLRDHWEPIEVEVIREDDGEQLRAADLPWMAGNVLVVRSSVMKTLSSCCPGLGERLPLRGAEGLVLVHPLAMTHALDVGSSNLVRLRSGRVIRVLNHVFNQRMLPEADLFLLDVLPEGPLYATDRFASCVRSQGLTGITLTRVWPQ